MSDANTTATIADWTDGWRDHVCWLFWHVDDEAQERFLTKLSEMGCQEGELATDEQVMAAADDAGLAWRGRDAAQAHYAAKQAATDARTVAAMGHGPCKYGDPLCPCQDGDMCHYEGPNPMTPPSKFDGQPFPQRALEAER